MPESSPYKGNGRSQRYKRTVSKSDRSDHNQHQLEVMDSLSLNNQSWIEILNLNRSL